MSKKTEFKTKQDIKDDAEDLAEDVKDTAVSTARSAREKAKETLDEATTAAKQQARRHASAVKEKAANSAKETAETLREAGEAFDPTSMINDAANRIADNLTEAARAVRSADLGHVPRDISAFARRNPLLFAGGAALLGFAAARLLKSSERAEAPDPGAPQQTGYSGSRADVEDQQWGYSK